MAVQAKAGIKAVSVQQQQFLLGQLCQHTVSIYRWGGATNKSFIRNLYCTVQQLLSARDY